MKSLVGYTGFVGSNLNKSHQFDGLYNSRNIEEAFGTHPELLVYSGVRAEKFLANKEPEKDKSIIENAIENIKQIHPTTLVLISTIDVYKDPVGVDENTVIDTNGLLPYGLNRYYLEDWVTENVEDHLILRLPGLYGENIKKNFIFDLIHFIPSMLNEKKMMELTTSDNLLSKYYISQNNGFYKCREVSAEEKAILKQFFNNAGFSALNFTDSRGIFQFYNLAYLWQHIQTALEKGIKLLNLATEPVSVSELYRYLKGTDFVNEIAAGFPRYDFRTIHSDQFGGEKGYLFNKEFVLKDIAGFVGGRMP